MNYWLKAQKWLYYATYKTTIMSRRRKLIERKVPHSSTKSYFQKKRQFNGTRLKNAARCSSNSLPFLLLWKTCVFNSSFIGNAFRGGKILQKWLLCEKVSHFVRNEKRMYFELNPLCSDDLKSLSLTTHRDQFQNSIEINFAKFRLLELYFFHRWLPNSNLAYRLCAPFKVLFCFVLL